MMWKCLFSFSMYKTAPQMEGTSIEDVQFKVEKNT